MVLKRCSSERGEREKRFYGDGKDERRGMWGILSLQRLGTSMGGSGTDWKRSLGHPFPWGCASCRMFLPVVLAVLDEELLTLVYITNGFDGTASIILNIR